MACDPNVLPKKDPLGPMKGPFSMAQRCFLGENINKYAFDFSIDFHKKYKNQGKYSFGY